MSIYKTGHEITTAIMGGRIISEMYNRGAKAFDVLPEGFTRVNYIESTGQQIIDTEFYGGIDSHATEIDFVYTKAQTATSLFAARTNAGVSPSPSRVGNLYFGQDGRFSVYVGSTGNLMTLPANARINVGDRRIARLEVDSVNHEVRRVLTTADQTPVLISEQSMAWSGTSLTLHPMGLCGGNTQNVWSEAASIKVYRFRLWENGVQTREFIPCLDSAGKACMYCPLTKRAYYNVRSNDDFLYG